MASILLIYASVHGQTRKITQHLACQLQSLGHDTEMADIQAAPDLTEFDSIILGASIRHGKHNPAVYSFIEQHQVLLEAKVSGFFSVSLVARKAQKNTPETNPYMQAFLSKASWKPKLKQVFGGNLHYASYGAFDRNAIRFIMWLTKGPTDLATQVEYTDWQKVDAFAEQISAASLAATQKA